MLIGWGRESGINADDELSRVTTRSFIVHSRSRSRYNSVFNSRAAICTAATFSSQKETPFGIHKQRPFVFFDLESHSVVVVTNVDIKTEAFAIKFVLLVDQEIDAVIGVGR